ncbi:SDR family oxidoreductase [Segetibacter sp. 3557_3]|uniref:SDR family oxidoreductase n=1 Tax=Segetibacter sp. 3557_3 TaxID=2547429 RepID=UPI001058F2DC|nr:SDR family oxidoreductase [Segetibacter sp. 3557_3]TDH20039.1 SDR family oxidoreductase [Segetibacter sp. 3557_3]
MSKVILITGTSSGIGLHTAVLLAELGYKVYATMRDTARREKLDLLANEKNVEVAVLPLDVLDDSTITKAVSAILSQESRIDVLINNAGSGFVRTMEHATMEDIQQVMEVNFYGPIRCMKAVLPSMREHKSGHIINVSSVGGLVGQPMNEIYCAAKFALEGLTESMATYLKPYFGIHTSLVEPGGVITEFTNTVMKNFDDSGGVRNDAYEPLATDYMNYRKVFTDEVRARVFQTAGQVAQVIADCIADPAPKLRYLTSDSAKEFTHLKTGLDPTGEILQQTIRDRILNK